RALYDQLNLRVGQRRAAEVENTRAVGVVVLRIPVEVVDINQRLAVGHRSGLQRLQVLVGKPVRAGGRGRKLSLPVVDSLEAVVDRAKQDGVRKLILDGFGERDGLGDVIVRANRTRSLDFKMRRIPQLRFVVQGEERRVRRICGEDSREFLVESPDEFVHVDVGVGGRRRYGEGRR